MTPSDITILKDALKRTAPFPDSYVGWIDNNGHVHKVTAVRAMEGCEWAVLADDDYVVLDGPDVDTCLAEFAIVTRLA